MATMMMIMIRTVVFCLLVGSMHSYNLFGWNPTTTTGGLSFAQAFVVVAPTAYLHPSTTTSSSSSSVVVGLAERAAAVTTVSVPSTRTSSYIAAVTSTRRIPSTMSTSTTTTTTTSTCLSMVFNKKNKKKNTDYDLSDIESRDMTPEEMAEYNRRFDSNVNTELWGMTIFSLVISIPLLYLVWVGFYSETSQVAGSL